MDFGTPRPPGFASAIIIETRRIGTYRTVRSARTAGEVLVSEWPVTGRGKPYARACSAVVDALAGDGAAEDARLAFIAAAKKAGIFVREEQ